MEEAKGLVPAGKTESVVAIKSTLPALRGSDDSVLAYFDELDKLEG